MSGYFEASLFVLGFLFSFAWGCFWGWMISKEVVVDKFIKQKLTKEEGRDYRELESPIRIGLFLKEKLNKEDLETYLFLTKSKFN